MTGREALDQAIAIYPLDLAGRITYIRYRWDNCDPDQMGAWEYAYKVTRGKR